MKRIIKNMHITGAEFGSQARGLFSEHEIEMELVTLLLNVHPKVEQLAAVVQLGNYFSISNCIVHRHHAEHSFVPI